MVTFLLDTNVVSEGMKERPDRHVTDWLATIDEQATLISVITIVELREGIELMASGRRRRRIEDWLEQDLIPRLSSKVMNIDVPIAQGCGRLFAADRCQGRSTSAMDLMIAATAQVHALTVVTRNVRDFDHLGVPVFNPWLDG